MGSGRLLRDIDENKMTRKSLKIATFILAAAGWLSLQTGCSSMKTDHSPSAGSDPNTTVYTLDNGMTVVIKEDHFAPVAALQVWVKAGGADEADIEAGVAHVHEHMLFKGT
jgi:secreted Zn-dependent insulinase-like peptidase